MPHLFEGMNYRGEKRNIPQSRFTNLVDQIMSVPHEEIKQREAEYKKQGRRES